MAEARCRLQASHGAITEEEEVLCFEADHPPRSNPTGSPPLPPCAAVLQSCRLCLESRLRRLAIQWREVPATTETSVSVQTPFNCLFAVRTRWPRPAKVSRGHGSEASGGRPGLQGGGRREHAGLPGRRYHAHAAERRPAVRVFGDAERVRVLCMGTRGH